MDDKTDRTNKVRIWIWVSQQEKQLISSLASSLKLSVNNFVKKILFEKIVKLQKRSPIDSLDRSFLDRDFRTLVELYVRLKLSLDESQQQELTVFFERLESLIEKINNYSNSNNNDRKNL